MQSLPNVSMTISKDHSYINTALPPTVIPSQRAVNRDM